MFGEFLLSAFSTDINFLAKILRWYAKIITDLHKIDSVLLAECTGGLFGVQFVNLDVI